MGSPCRTPISHPHPRLLSHLSLTLADPIKARTSLNSPPPPKEKKTHLCHRQGRSRRHFILSLPPLHALLLANCCQALEGFDAVSERERDANQLTSRRVGEAVELLKKGRESQAQGDFGLALRYYTLVIEGYKDFALSEYARVGRALALYEVGDRDEAIAEMEDVSISLRGYPEVHAALAAALYVDKHAPLLAENQFTIATLLDPHYTDVSYVRETKHWPPSLVSSLQQFITLT